LHAYDKTDQTEEYGLPESGKPVETGTSEEAEDAAVKEEEKRKKARLRRRGPYRKAHADW
jgi:hypothetical protein